MRGKELNFIISLHDSRLIKMFFGGKGFQCVNLTVYLFRPPHLHSPTHPPTPPPPLLLFIPLHLLCILILLCIKATSHSLKRSVKLLFLYILILGMMNCSILWSFLCLHFPYNVLQINYFKCLIDSQNLDVKNCQNFPPTDRQTYPWKLRPRA